jgi:hypothetical protein
LKLNFSIGTYCLKTSYTPTSSTLGKDAYGDILLPGQKAKHHNTRSCTRKKWGKEEKS